MPVPLRYYKKKISSLGNSKKISKAMEMISAVKMRKSIAYAQRAAEYAIKIDLLSKELVGLGVDSPYLKYEGESERSLWIVVGTNRGLCGNFNTSLLAKCVSQTESNLDNIDFIIVGKKLASYIRSVSSNIIAIYESIPDQPSFDQVDSITDQITKLYGENGYKEVVLIYNEPVSAIKNMIVVKKILPIELDEIIENEEIDDIGHKIEPNRSRVFEETLQRLIEAKIFYGILQSQAGEHSARMIAMKNAGDAAKSMIDALTLDANKIRQADITQKITEISNASQVIN